MLRIPIERRSSLSPSDFSREYLSGLGKPVIVTDAMNHWPARSKWTLDHFKRLYGADFASATPGLHSDTWKVTKLASYIDFLHKPATELPGFWVGGENGRPLRNPPRPDLSPLYLMGWHAFRIHPELYADIIPAPYFLPDWTLALDPTLRDIFEATSGRDYWSIYIGGPGSLSKLHQDFWHTHGYLAQIQGRKRMILFSPAESEFVGAAGFDPEQPENHATAPVTALECTLSPGELLFIPRDWWHHVRSLDNTITVSHNFFNEINFSEQLTGILRQLPVLVSGIESSADWREELRIRWRSSGFTPPDKAGN